MDRIKRIKGILAICVMLSLILSGCGGGFVDLTEDESRQIVNYSTNVLNDHNTAVKGSLQNLTQTDLRDIVIKDDPSLIDEIEAAKEQATAEAEEAAAPPESGGEGEGGEGGETEDSENAPLEVQDADIASIIGLSGFTVNYSGHEILDSYPTASGNAEDMLFSMEPATPDDRLLVLYFDITNNGEEEAECNILNLQPKFRFSSGGTVQSFLTTLLLDDLSTLSVTVPAGKSTRAVLVAEISNEKAESLSDITLIIKGEEENTEIILEH